MAACAGKLKHKTAAIVDADAAYAQLPLAKLTGAEAQCEVAQQGGKVRS